MKAIPLTRGKFALVDDADFEWLTQFKWSYHSEGYAVRTWPDNKAVLMHREILETPSGMDTDHKDRNRLNNQRNNLRIASRSQNLSNRVSAGIGWAKREQRWRARIKVNKKEIHLGYFQDKSLAKEAYEKAKVKYFGEFSCKTQ